MTQLLYVPDAPQVTGLDHHTQNLFEQAWRQWQLKIPRNIERLVYLDGKNKLKDLKVSIPPELVDRLNVVSGWAEKAVSEPTNRTVWEGVVDENGNDDPLGIAQLLYANRFRVELRQGIRAAYSYSCSFASQTPGDTAAGEPEVINMFHSAMYATGIWDRRRRELSVGLLINEVDPLGRPLKLTIMLPYENVVCVKGPVTWYVESVLRSPVGRVTLEVYPNNPELDRPFGRSRIDRRVMSIVDRAVRGGSRLDVHSEIFSAMKLFLLGVGEEAFLDDQGNTVPMWDFYLGRMNALGVNEEGDKPDIKSISAESPEPHIATLRQYASEFSGHTGVPLGSLGIAQDQPESADAKNVAREDMLFLVENQHEVLGQANRRSFENMVMIRDRTDVPPPEAATLEQIWRRPDRASQAALADAGYKQVEAADLKGTRVGMRMIGMSQALINQAESEKRRAGSAQLLEQIRASGPAPAAPESGSAASGLDEALKEAQVQRAKGDALGSYRRAGVKAESAARLVGIEDVEFIPGDPITIRQPE